MGLPVPVQFPKLKDADRGECRPHQHYRKRSNLQLMTKSYNEGDTQDKATVVVVACRGGQDGF
jgi:hypothetical protein